MSCELCKGEGHVESSCPVTDEIDLFRTRLEDCGFKIKADDVSGMLDEVADFVEIMSNFTKRILRAKK